MNYCEDYPACGHGPASTGGDSGGCPDAQGRFNCVLCGEKMKRGATSAICGGPDDRRAAQAMWDGEDNYAGEDY